MSFHILEKILEGKVQNSTLESYPTFLPLQHSLLNCRKQCHYPFKIEPSLSKILLWMFATQRNNGCALSEAHINKNFYDVFWMLSQTSYRQIKFQRYRQLTIVIIIIIATGYSFINGSLKHTHNQVILKISYIHSARNIVSLRNYSM